MNVFGRMFGGGELLGIYSPSKYRSTQVGGAITIIWYREDRGGKHIIAISNCSGGGVRTRYFDRGFEEKTHRTPTGAVRWINSRLRRGRDYE